MQVVRQIPPLTTAVVTYTTVAGLSTSIPLAGTALAARFTANPGASWVVASEARPSSELGPLLQNLEASLGIATIDALLTGADAPMPALRQLWGQNELFGYKYGALLLGIIYALNRVPQAA